MSGSDETDRTQVILSFSSAYAHLARRLAANLRAAHIEVQFDQWEGGGGVRSKQSVNNGLADAAFVLPLLTPSNTARTWMSEEWKRKVYDEARSRGIGILPVLGEHSNKPKYLSSLSYADLCKRNYDLEVRRLIQTIRDTTGDTHIELPEVGGTDSTFRLPIELPVNDLVLEVAANLEFLLADGAAADESAGAPFQIMLDELFWGLGVKFPEPNLQVVANLAPSRFRVVINGVPETEAEARPHCVMVNRTVAALAALGLDAEPGVNPLNGAETAWVSCNDANAHALGDRTMWSAQQYLICVLSSVLRRKAADFIGIEDASAMLEQIEPIFPNLVAESVPKTVPLFIFTDVLRRLVVEGISIRDMRQILMCLSDWGRVEDDPLMLTEYVRSALKRTIMHQYCRGSRDLAVFLLDPQIEDMIRASMRHTATGSYLDLNSGTVKAILNAIQKPLVGLPGHAQMPSILTTIEIRSSVHRLIAPSTGGVGVLSYDELPFDINIQPVGRIKLDGFKARKRVSIDGAPLWS